MSSVENITSPSHEITVRRAARIPDPLRVARYHANPEFGPRLLFFSGGTALNNTSRHLTHYTHNSIHLTTAFDSGGSSGKLRGPFGILAVGDMRSRLMALADRTVLGQNEVFNLFAARLSKTDSQQQCLTRLRSIAGGNDSAIRDIPSPMRGIICNHLLYFLREMPEDFDLRGASIGNLVLVGGFLNNNRDIEAVVLLFSKLVEVRGTVCPIASGSYHLAAKLDDGVQIVGQHLLTGKEVPPIQTSVTEVHLVDRLDEPDPITISVEPRVEQLIADADLICFPMGSFYSSIVANLLPHGVGAAVAARNCPKVYVPNTSTDPEQRGMSMCDCVEVLLKHLRRSSTDSNDLTTGNLLHHVLIHDDLSMYETEPDLDRIEKLGVGVIRTQLITPASAALIDEQLLTEALLSLT